MAKATAGTERAKNTVVLGLIAGWFGIGAVAVMKGIRKKLAKKGDELVEANQRAFDAGRAFALENPLKVSMQIVPSETKGQVKLITDGNDMCAAAAIFAGCQFFGGYPITPSTEIMQFFTDRGVEVRRRGAPGRGRDRRHRRGRRRLLRRQEGHDRHQRPRPVPQDRDDGAGQHRRTARW